MKRTSFLVAALVLPFAAQAQQPLSAIDWLDKQVAVPVAQPLNAKPTNEPPVSKSALTPGVEVTPLDAVRADAVGLLPTATTGLPRTLWTASDQATLIRLLGHMDARPLPAIQALNYTLLLAEADAPTQSSADAKFLRARVHALVGYGAIEPARALLERAGPGTDVLFDTWLSLTLLSGDEDQPCAMLRQRPQLSHDYGARVYCIARAGDWDTAALTYDTAVALGNLKGAEADLLAQYLDPEVIETTPIPPMPKSPSPLVFRLYESSGAPLPTRRLPVGFAMADLRGTAGWKSEVEAAERLARTGAVSASRLLGLYTERQPAASGGLWDRVKAIQAFDKALFTRSPEDVAKTLPDAWSAAKSQSLETQFAQMFSDKLLEITLPDPARAPAQEITLLSQDYEIAAGKISPETARDRLLIGIAKGSPSPDDATSGMQRAIVAGFAAQTAAGEHETLLQSGKLGEVILRASQLIGHGATGSENHVTEALATLRAVGLEDTARRAALQLILLGSPQ